MIVSTTVPIPGPGDTSKFLRGDWTWADISGGGDFVKAVDDTDDITEGAVKKFATAAEKTKLSHITVTQAVDLDAMESDIAGKAPTNSPAFTGTPTGITKSHVGLGNADNTSDANKPVSAAVQAALDAKQATLVSGTNIKTINGASVLGSGNLVVSGTPPDVTLYKLSPAGNTTIPAGYGAYVVGFFEIVAGITLTIENGGVLEIG